MTPKTRFTLTIERVRDANTTHALRALLKTLVRRHGFRCIDAREVSSTGIFSDAKAAADAVSASL